MNLPIIIAFSAIVFAGIITIIFSHQAKKTKKLNADFLVLQKNHEYIIYLLRELQDVFGNEGNLENVIDVIAKSLESTFNTSVVSSIFVSESRTVFKSHAKETVSHAYIDHIKDTLSASIKTISRDSIEEKITGVALDDIGRSEIKSTVDIPLTVNGQIKAIINM